MGILIYMAGCSEQFRLSSINFGEVLLRVRSVGHDAKGTRV